jgi:predicted dehydrogenase
MALTGLALLLPAILYSCVSEKKESDRMAGDMERDVSDAYNFTGAEGEVKLMTLDPGHFHAALVQKSMYDQVSPTVFVYAPKGPDVADHLARIDGFNNRRKDPTSWNEVVYSGDDFLEKMIQESPGNVVVLSGNNRKKAEYILSCAEAGLNVLADKPMCIDGAGYDLLVKAFKVAQEKGVLIYDVMTERFEITSVLQRELANDPTVLGELDPGSADDPSVIKESVHHFFKFVAGNPIKRPPWFFDTTQQGEGIVDVTTHLIDLSMWGLFPGETLEYGPDVVIKKAKRWPTFLSKKQFQKVTKLEVFPEYLKKDLQENGMYPCYANGEIVFALKGIHVKISVKWNYQAPEGGGDTHYSMIRGSKAMVVILQGEKQKYRPELFVKAADSVVKSDYALALSKAIHRLQKKYPGIELEERDEVWRVVIPDKYRIGHEAHFSQVMKNYLNYLIDGELPRWEIPNMITKYRITTEALSDALK